MLISLELPAICMKKAQLKHHDFKSPRFICIFLLRIQSPEVFYDLLFLKIIHRIVTYNSTQNQQIFLAHLSL